MTTASSLQAILSSGDGDQSPARRGELASRIADLFVADGERYTEEQVGIFDVVLGRLTVGIEEQARQALASRLASHANAPTGIIQTLAMDTSLSVALPVLSQSPRVSDETLVARAKSGEQAHLIAIAERARVSESVTDVLVERGDGPVLHRIAGNSGAKFSLNGYSTLVGRSTGDDALSLTIGARTDLSQHLLLKLVASASDTVRKRLEETRLHRTDDVRRVVEEVARQARERLGHEAVNYEAAQAAVLSMRQAGTLNDPQVRVMAERRMTDHVIAALSLLGDLPIEAVEMSFRQPRYDGIVVLCRAVGLSWATTRAILVIKAGAGGVSSQVMEQAVFSFERLSPETARLALKIQRQRAQTN